MAASPYLAKLPTLIDNLTRLYSERIDADDYRGREWYPIAQHIVRDWSKSYGVPVVTVACVIAAISPQIDWERNLIAADDVLADRAISIGGPLPKNVAKARRILQDRASQMLPYFPYGPKVASFACNLAGDMSVVTVDGHATQAALDDVESRLSLNWTRYAIFAEAYRLAAKTVGEVPATFQAIIWCEWKRLYPRTEKIRRRTQWSAVGEL